MSLEETPKAARRQCLGNKGTKHTDTVDQKLPGLAGWPQGNGVELGAFCFNRFPPGSAFFTLLHLTRKENYVLVLGMLKQPMEK